MRRRTVPPPILDELRDAAESVRAQRRRLRKSASSHPAAPVGFDRVEAFRLCCEVLGDAIAEIHDAQEALSRRAHRAYTQTQSRANGRCPRRRPARSKRSRRRKTAAPRTTSRSSQAAAPERSILLSTTFAIDEARGRMTPLLIRLANLRSLLERRLQGLDATSPRSLDASRTDASQCSCTSRSRRECPEPKAAGSRLTSRRRSTRRAPRASRARQCTGRRTNGTARRATPGGPVVSSRLPSPHGTRITIDFHDGAAVITVAPPG